MTTIFKTTPTFPGQIVRTFIVTDDRPHQTAVWTGGSWILGRSFRNADAAARYVSRRPAIRKHLVRA